MTHKTFRLGIFVLAGVLLTSPATAAVKNWAAGDGNWSVAANWAGGVPTDGDDAKIVFADAAARTVTYDYTGPAVPLGSITLDQTGGGNNASKLSIPANSLSETTATVGDVGNGQIDQTGGVHTISSLTLGSSASGMGCYTLSGSSSSLQAAYETIGQSATGNGTQSGGTFTQSGGSHQVSQLNMAENSGSTATYELNGGTLYAYNAESVGVAGTATFNQSSGTNSMGELELGHNIFGFESTGNGTYLISGGRLNTNEINVGGNLLGGGNGVGVLSISGANTVVDVGFGALSVSNTLGSSINFQAGTLIANSINVNGIPSLFNWTGGKLELTQGADWDSAGVSTSTSVIFGSSLTLSSNRTLRVDGNETIGGSGPFNFTLSGGTHVVSGDITLKAGGTFSETSSPLLLTYTNFNQMGGTLSTFTNTSNYVYQGGSITGQFTNNGTATFAATVSISGNVQNNGTLTVNNGQQFASGIITNLGSFVLAGGSIVQNTFTNSAGATLTAHGSMGQLVNHGTFILDGVLAISNSSSTNDGTVQGAGTVNITSSPFTNSAGGIINATTAGATLAFTTPVTNLAGAVINIGPSSTFANGSITNSWTNSGVVNLQGAGAKLSGNPITNVGTIQGFGLVSSSFANGNAGVIRATGGELNFTAQSFSNAPGGQIQAATGGSAVFLQGMSTNSGMISLTGGTFDNAIHSLTNNGTINGFGTIRTSGLTNSTGKLLSIGEGNMDVFGNFTNNGVVNIQTGRSAYFYGTVNGNGSFTGGGTAVFLNSLSPGNSPASVTMSGSATLVGGTALAMELGGNTPGTQYDQLHVGGTLSIGGILSVSLINGFTPTIGSSFDLLDWGTLSGTFSSLSLPTLATGQWDTSQLYTTGLLSVVASPLAGDYNNNGVVDAADYVAWRHGLGTTYTQTDYDVWRANFGNSAASGSGSQFASGQAPVPEPSEILLALFGLCYSAAVGRQRGRS